MRQSPSTGKSSSNTRRLNPESNETKLLFSIAVVVRLSLRISDFVQDSRFRKGRCHGPWGRNLQWQELFHHLWKPTPSVPQFKHAAYPAPVPVSHTDTIHVPDEFTALVKFEDKPGKAHYFPFGYDEGELSEEELEKLEEEPYKLSSSFLTYVESEHEPRRLDAGAALAAYEPGGLVADAIAPSEDPTIWKVKCVVGRERLSAFCLMQKYVDLQSLGTKLNIISAFVVEHVTGFIYIEAERQFDVVEACKGIFIVYSSCAAPVPKNKVSRFLSMQNKCNNVSVGSWARVKNGKYKGDLAEVIAVNEA